MATTKELFTFVRERVFRKDKRFVLACEWRDQLREIVEAMMTEHSDMTSSVSPDKGGKVAFLGCRLKQPVLFDLQTEQMYSKQEDIVRVLRANHNV